MSDTVKILLTAFLSGSVLGFIQFLITRWDNKRNLGKKIDNLSHDFKKHNAELARTHILRFNDELHNNVYHSEEYFKQTILDIDTYDKYCADNPDFANGLTVMASQYIKDEFRRTYLERKNEPNN